MASAEQQLLPIDVNYQKLAEWLVQRQKLPSDWHKMVHAIQAKMSEAVKQLPPGFLASLDLDKDTALDYFAAVEISKGLDAQEGSRNLLGVRTGNAAVWEKVVRAYEKNLLYIGEASQTMIQNAEHEIPYLRKQAARYDQLVSDSEKRQAELLKGATTCAAAYKEECAKLGIKGANIRTELQLLVQQLPGMFLEVVEQLQQPLPKEAVDFYQQFAVFSHELKEGFHDQTLPVLKQVMRATLKEPIASVKGKDNIDSSIATTTAVATGEQADTTTAAGGIDWDLSGLTNTTEGPVPEAIDWDVSADSAAPAASTPTGIDWDVALDVGGQESAGGGGINWDVDVTAEAAEGPSTAGIDWDGVAGESGEAGPAGDIDWDIDVSGQGADGTAPVEIDWDLDITAEESTSATPLEVDWDVDVGVEEGQPEGSRGDKDAAETTEQVETGTTSGRHADPSSTAEVVERLQHDAEFRARLLDDVQELGAFLAMRKTEMQSGSADMFLALLPEVLQHVTREHVASMSATIEEAKNQLLSSRLRQLLLIMTSPQYLDRLVRTLEVKAGQEARLVASRKEVQARQNESTLALKELQPKIQKLVEKTRHVKAVVENALAAQFGGRRVNVLGEINVVLAQST